MSHIDIFAKFLELFPAFQWNVRSWEPRGATGVVVETSDATRLAFTYFNDREWMLITTNNKVRRI